MMIFIFFKSMYKINFIRKKKVTHKMDKFLNTSRIYYGNASTFIFTRIININDDVKI